jgi:hypothetical protein
VAKIRLKNTKFFMEDGTTGTALVNEPITPAAMGATDFDIEAVDLPRALVTTKVPVGARFTVAGETGAPIHTVTARTPPGAGPTTNIVFTPALASGVADNAAITFQSQQLEFKVGEGNVSWTETTNYDIELERGDLETGTISDGDDEAMTVDAAFTWEYYRTGTGETVSPVDALKGVGGAAEWVTAGADECEPYAVKLVALHTPPCGSKDPEKYTFPEFRRTTVNPDFEAATISFSGICKAVEPIVERITS